MSWCVDGWADVGTRCYCCSPADGVYSDVTVTE